MDRLKIAQRLSMQALFPRFLEMVNLEGARVQKRWMIVKTLGAAISLGCGASVGREGPIAQIGGSIGSAVDAIRTAFETLLNSIDTECQGSSWKRIR